MNKQLFILVSFFLILLAACSNTAPVAESAGTETESLTAVSSPTAIAITETSTSDVMVVDEAGNTAVDPTALDNALAEINATGLTADEQDNLIYMREEEKLAHDVYMTLYTQWNLPIFQNIANSEATHTEAIRTLLLRYGLEDPAVNQGLGSFTNETLQALYEQLVAAGSQSLADALTVGATIEDLDIVDLQDSLAQTDKADISLVYENLMKGSRNHLRAFTNTLQQQTGGTYQPQYLDQATYEAIIASEVERGRGQGQGGPPADRPGKGQGNG
ncbi:MAG: DUF2202 domain-containing protein [Ardenticatenaceae bacterium]|nr:DUF2202 domain-containing protein [Ardenticatenaceae bacterium]